MTATTYRTFKVHEVARDPVYAAITAALVIEACWDGSGIIEGFGPLERAARAIGMDPCAAARVLGLRLEPRLDSEAHYTGLTGAAPDGVRACYADECQHSPDYVAEPWRPSSIHG